jgi:hypothetical protein
MLYQLHWLYTGFGRIITHGELVKMWKWSGPIVRHCISIYEDGQRQAKEIQCQLSWPPVQEMNSKPPKYKAQVLILHPIINYCDQTKKLLIFHTSAILVPIWWQGGGTSLNTAYFSKPYHLT